MGTGNYRMNKMLMVLATSDDMATLELVPVRASAMLRHMCNLNNVKQ